MKGDTIYLSWTNTPSGRKSAPDVIGLLNGYYPSNEVHLCQVRKSRDARHGQRNAIHVVSVHIILPFPRNLVHSHAAVPSTKQRASRTFCGQLQNRTCQAESGGTNSVHTTGVLIAYRSIPCPSAPVHLLKPSWDAACELNSIKCYLLEISQMVVEVSKWNLNSIVKMEHGAATLRSTMRHLPRIIEDRNLLGLPVSSHAVLETQSTLFGVVIKYGLGT
ncbi:hypothetical protein RB195_022658 [Necator americanus]|uniref:Uncharacterized protein n=1 Tax=Necator americanus TaxID=51031 RepID=A0ABR1EG51_NECAM